MGQVPPFRGEGPATPTPGNKPIWLGIGIGIAVVLAILVGLGLAGVFRFGAPPQSGNLQVSATKPSGTLQVAANQPPPVLQQAAPDKPATMPDDVRDWLEHLRRIEEERQRMSNEQLSKALVSMAALSGGGADLQMLKGLAEEAATGESAEMTAPTQKAAEDTQAMRQAWVDLRTKFVSRPVPQECMGIADRYDQVLRETGGMLGDIIQAFNSAQQDPSAAIATLNGMKGRSKTMIDQPASEADRGIGEICAKYNTRQWFHIQMDQGGGGLLQVPGF